MTLYLHIGAQKTGSTTIQAAIYENRDMLRGLGLEYPEVEPEDGNRVSHYNSMRGFFSGNADEIAATKSFVARVNGLQGDVLISSEVLSNWPGPGGKETAAAYWKRKQAILEQMRDAFAQKDVRVIYCVRRRASYLKSLFKQHLKMLKQPSLSIDDELRSFLEREVIRSDSAAQIKVFTRIFKDVRVIDFDEHAKAGTLLPAFTALLDRDIDLRDAEVKNVSPDWTQLEVMRLKHTLGLVPPEGFPAPDMREAYNNAVETMVSDLIDQAIANA